jgi:hypothetical protein
MGRFGFPPVIVFAIIRPPATQRDTRLAVSIAIRSAGSAEEIGKHISDGAVTAQ